MTTRPYHSIQLRSGVKGALKGEEMQRARDIDQFMKEISVAAISTVVSGLNLENVEAALSKASVSSAYT